MIPPVARSKRELNTNKKAREKLGVYKARRLGDKFHHFSENGPNKADKVIEPVYSREIPFFGKLC